METVFHNFVISAPVKEVFDAVSTPSGLTAWWSKTCSGERAEGEIYHLGFGPGFEWQAVVSIFEPNTKFELRFTDAMEDWIGTRVGFVLKEQEGATNVEFYHAGWSAQTEHFKISSFCWATYLRLMRRFVEFGETVEYERRDAA